MGDREKIVQLIKEEQLFYLASHILPDGDSIGSLLALGEGLRNMGKTAVLFSPGAVPRKYAFLRGASEIRSAQMDTPPEAVVIALDCSDIERFGPFKEQVVRGRELINIDHHVTNRRYGTANLVDPAAAATGEIIYRLLQELRAPLTGSIAEALYVAVATDTGSFKYENTTPATHRVAAALLEHGVRPAVLSQHIFDERPLSFYLLLKEAFSTLELHGGGKIAVMTISKEMLERHGTTVDEVEGLVNYTRNIEGVELGILFYVESPAEVKVGFRSRTVDVSLLAAQLNGGGHARAAGCRLHGSYRQARQKVLEAAESALREPERGGER